LLSERDRERGGIAGRREGGGSNGYAEIKIGLDPPKRSIWDFNFFSMQKWKESLHKMA
jgi:hypothetical protein